MTAWWSRTRKRGRLGVTAVVIAIPFWATATGDFAPEALGRHLRRGAPASTGGGVPTITLSTNRPGFPA
ncbi:MAG TPA: hypothetical protein VED63_01730 [Acidimicrobiales bacterium]|nr:hypothetical protein [Acidimicrobiales bacterium]